MSVSQTIRSFAIGIDRPEQSRCLGHLYGTRYRVDPVMLRADPENEQGLRHRRRVELRSGQFFADTRSMDQVLDLVESEGLTVEWVLDTHPHADHVMASSRLGYRTGAPNAIGEKVREIADLWRGFYNTPDAYDTDRDFDRLFADGDILKVGELEVRVMLSPGHTLGSITYICGDAGFFADDTLMQRQRHVAGRFPRRLHR